jgi:hypothetical protein
LPVVQLLCQLTNLKSNFRCCSSERL